MKKIQRGYHHGDLKTAMISATLELVRKKGPRGFTMKEASRNAGVSVSAPYNHFKDKEALLIEIVILGNETLETELRAASDTAASIRERLLAVYLAYITFARRHPDLFTLMFNSGIDKAPYPEVQASAAKAFDIAVTLALQLESLPERGAQLALAVWTMAHGFAALSVEHSVDLVCQAEEWASAEALGRRLLFSDKSAQ